MDSIQGHALVASPYLEDPNFLRSVVYILQHDGEGAAGLVLNRPTEVRVGGLLAELDDTKVECDEPVHWGGPVDGPLMLLQEMETPSGTAIFAATEQERILQMYTSVKVPAVAGSRRRLFDGYSGWGPGQLDAELKGGGWMVWNITPQQVFACPDELWECAVKSIGREVLLGGIKSSLIPEDPAFN